MSSKELTQWDQIYFTSVTVFIKHLMSQSGGSVKVRGWILAIDVGDVV